jgi:TIR domain
VPTRSRIKQHCLFFSHSHQDRWIAKQCVRLIEEAGKGRIKVFLDERDLETGESIPDSIRERIIQCDEFVVLLSISSKDRLWVLVETSVARAHGKRIITIMDKVAPTDMLEIIQSYKAVDLNEFHRYLKELLARLKAGTK